MSSLFITPDMVVLFIVLLLAFDRWVLKRGTVVATGIEFYDTNNGYHRFELKFSAKLPLKFTQITYELRDCKLPTLVLTGKSRALDFSSNGENSELLLIESKLFNQDTDWNAHVKITSAGSRINPFYKIFPAVSVIDRFVVVEPKLEDAEQCHH